MTTSKTILFIFTIIFFTASLTITKADYPQQNSNIGNYRPGSNEDGRRFWKKRNFHPGMNNLMFGKRSGKVNINPLFSILQKAGKDNYNGKGWYNKNSPSGGYVVPKVDEGRFDYYNDNNRDARVSSDDKQYSSEVDRKLLALLSQENGKDENNYGGYGSPDGFPYNFQSVS